MTKKNKSAEKAIRNIRRATRRQYSEEKKIRLVLDGQASPALPSCASRMASIRTSIADGRKIMYGAARRVLGRLIQRVNKIRHSAGCQSPVRVQRFGLVSLSYKVLGY